METSAPNFRMVGKLPRMTRSVSSAHEPGRPHVNRFLKLRSLRARLDEGLRSSHLIYKEGFMRLLLSRRRIDTGLDCSNQGLVELRKSAPARRPPSEKGDGKAEFSLRLRCGLAHKAGAKIQEHLSGSDLSVLGAYQQPGCRTKLAKPLGQGCSVARTGTARQKSLFPPGRGRGSSVP